MKCEVPLIETVDTQEQNAGVAVNRTLRWRERVGLGSAVDSGGGNAESIRSSLGDAKELLLSRSLSKMPSGREPAGKGIHIETTSKKHKQRNGCT